MTRNRTQTGDDFLIEIAKLYYENDQSQQDIANKFGISRSLVSNLLKRCRQQGVVQIQVNDPSSSILRLQRELVTRFSLRFASVAASSRVPEQNKVNVGKAAAVFLEPFLVDGVKIGISWGTTLYQVIEHVTPKLLTGVEIVQLQGGMGAVNTEIDGFGLARKLAEKLRGRYQIINAPLIVQGPRLKKLLLREPHIAEALTTVASADIAILGIGSNLPTVNAIVRAGFLSEKESLDLLKSGAVGNVCGLHIDAQGKRLPIPLNNRIIGIDFNSLLKIPIRLGVAAGELKVESILAAIRGQLINAIAVDEDLAAGLLQKSTARNI